MCQVLKYFLYHIQQCVCRNFTVKPFTLSGFDNQERNLTFVKTAFLVLKLNFLACSMKQAFYLFHKQNIARV